MLECVERRAMHPQDKTYGLLGLAPQVFAESVRPDYEASLEHVYISYTFEAIRHSISIEPMHTA
jgi:hypothetical protein